MIKLDVNDGYYDASEIIGDEDDEDFGATLGEIFQDICTKKGVECGSISFLNSNKKVYVYDNQLTAREYVSYIAECAGGFACAGRDGKLYIKSLYEDTAEISLKLFKTYKFGEEYKISRVAFEDGVRDFKYGDETRNTLWIRQENMFIVDTNEVQNIYNKVSNLTINSFEGTVIIDPRIDIGDKIIIGGKTILYQGEMSLSRRFIADIKSKISIKQKQETTVKKESQTVINRRVQSEINQIDGTITQLAEETTENSSNIAQLQLSAERIATRVSKTEEDIEDLQEQSISSVDVEYALGTSTTTAPTTGWSTSAPTWEQGKYMWQRTVTTYADNTTEISNPTCISGAKGDKGDTGSTGKGITSIIEYYAVSSSNSSAPADNSFSTTLQTMTSINKYLWNYELITYTDNNTEKTTKRVIGVYGDKGQDGTNGTNGNDGKGISSIVNKYAVSASNKTAPTNWQNTPQTMTTTNKYLWNYEIITYTDSTTYTSSPTVIGVYGDKGNDGTNGQDGDDGIGVQEVVEQYYLSNSNTQQTGGSWQTTQPTWVSGKYIWIRSKITWTDNTITYTTPVLASSINKANETAKSANDTANGVVTNFGTYVEQNWEHVKVAWNQISEFIQMMIINNNACFSILDENKNLLMSLDKKGQHFYKDGNTVFGEMGVNTIDEQNYISFGVKGEYDSEISNGMAWGITTESDNKFWPILYIKNFTVGPKNSDASSGELVLSACNLVLDGIGTGIKTGNVFISGDIAMGNVTFIDTETNTILMNIRPQNIIDYPAIDILGNISFYANQAGSNSFKIGNGANNCLFTDEGYVGCEDIYARNSIYTAGYLTGYAGISSNGYVSGKAFVNNSKLEVKKNIEKYSKKAIDEIKNTDIYEFNYKIEEDTDKKTIGAIIGNGYRCSKEIIANNGEGINTYSMTSVAYKAIQEQQEQIEELKEENKKKDEIISKLIERVEKLERKEEL